MPALPQAIALGVAVLAGSSLAIDESCWQRGGEYACDASSLLQIHVDDRAGQAEGSSRSAQLPDLTGIVDGVIDAIGGGASNATGSALASAAAQASEAVEEALGDIREDIDDFQAYATESQEAILGNLTSAAAADATFAELTAGFQGVAAEVVSDFEGLWQPVAEGFEELAPQLVGAVEALGRADLAEHLNGTLGRGLARLEGFSQSIGQAGALIEGMSNRSASQLQDVLRRVNSSLEEGLLQLDNFIVATGEGLDELSDGILLAIDRAQDDDKARIAGSLEHVGEDAEEILAELRQAASQLAQGLGTQLAPEMARNGAAPLRPALLLLVPLLRWL